MSPPPRDRGKGMVSVVGCDNGNEAAYWARVGEIVRAMARRAGLPYDDVEECLAEFRKGRIGRLASVQAENSSAAERTKLNREIRWHLRSWVRERNKFYQRYESLDLLLENARSGNEEPVSPEPGPEARALRRDEVAAVLRIVAGLPERRQWLWRRVALDGATVVELAAETGRVTGALYKELHATRKAILLALSSDSGTEPNTGRAK